MYPLTTVCPVHPSSQEKKIMKKEIYWLVAAIMIVNVGAAHATSNSQGCQMSANVFLAHPNQKNLTALDSNADDQCWRIIGKSNANLKRLLASVSMGNYYAAIYLAKNLKSLGGGNLEDALVALGNFSNTHMTELLDFANKGTISEHELTDALTMLPLSMSDNQSAQLSAMQARRNIVNQVKRSDLANQKSVALKAIDDFIAEIKASQS
jgi:hypothetical protein